MASLLDVSGYKPVSMSKRLGVGVEVPGGGELGGLNGLGGIDELNDHDLVKAGGDGVVDADCEFNALCEAIYSEE